MGVDPRGYGEETFRQLGVRAPAFDPAKVWCHWSKWAPEPNFRKVFRRGIEREFTVLHNAQLVDAEIRDGEVREVEVANFRGERRRWPCGRLVVAAGGLESNRILLWLQERRGFLRGGAAEALGRVADGRLPREPHAGLRSRPRPPRMALHALQLVAIVRGRVKPAALGCQGSVGPECYSRVSGAACEARIASHGADVSSAAPGSSIACGDRRLEIYAAFSVA